MQFGFFHYIFLKQINDFLSKLTLRLLQEKLISLTVKIR